MIFENLSAMVIHLDQSPEPILLIFKRITKSPRFRLSAFYCRPTSHLAIAFFATLRRGIVYPASDLCSRRMCRGREQNQAIGCDLIRGAGCTKFRTRPCRRLSAKGYPVPRRGLRFPAPAL